MIRIAVMTFGAGLTVPSCDLVVLPLATGPVFLPESTFFSMATVTLQILIEQLSATSYSKRIATLREHPKVRNPQETAKTLGQLTTQRLNINP